MTSPDVTPYVDVQLSTRTRQDIFEEMLALAALRFPDWTPLEAHTETLLLEVWAEVIHGLEQRLNLAPAAAFEGLVRLLQVARDPGSRPAGTVTMSIAPGTTLTQTIPADTRLRFLPADGTDELELVVAAAVAFPPGDVTVAVPVTGLLETSAYNGVSAGAIVLVDQLTFIDGVTLTGAFVDGRDPEDSAAYLSRGAARLARLTTTLVHVDQFQAAALDDPVVRRAVAVDNFNSDAGSGNPGDHPGHVTVAASGTGGAPLTSGQKAALVAALESQALALLEVHVTDATVTAINVTAQLERDPSYDDATVVAAAAQALADHLNADTWPYAASVYRNELISLLDQVPGVRRVVSLTAPATDVALTGIAPLADLGTATITTIP